MDSLFSTTDLITVLTSATLSSKTQQIHIQNPGLSGLSPYMQIVHSTMQTTNPKSNKL